MKHFCCCSGVMFVGGVVWGSNYSAYDLQEPVPTLIIQWPTLLLHEIGQ